jgi:rfaE bifunctional protein nucleotidyltransferase chain/domain
MTDKILPLDELAAQLDAARTDGRRVVLCHGVFDLLHPGHIQHFREARSLGDVLVVTVTADQFVNKGPGRPAFNHGLRMESLAALDCVSFVGLSEWPSAVEVIKRLKPHVYVKGSEYADAGKDVTGQITEEVAAVQEVGGDVHYSIGIVFSSSSLINTWFSTLPPAADVFIRGFRERHTVDEVLGALHAIADLRVLVIGDIIIDQYCYVTPLAKSPRESIIASQYVSEEQFAGGSLAIANHLAGLCKEVTLLATLGPDPEHLTFVKEHLRPNVQLQLQHTPTRPTVVKRRFLEATFLSKLFEIQVLDDSPHDDETDRALEHKLHAAIPEHDLVVVADFGHGLLTHRLRRMLTSSDAWLGVNTQANSANLGFNTIAGYDRVNFGCIHELELRLATRSKHGGIHELAERTLRSLQADRFMVTAGPRGTMLLEARGGTFETPSLAARVIDRVGAGDTVFSTAAPLVFRGVNSEIVGLLGNCGGSMAVQTVCNRSFIDRSAMAKFIMHLLK